MIQLEDMLNQLADLQKQVKEVSVAAYFDRLFDKELELSLNRQELLLAKRRVARLKKRIQGLVKG